MKVRRNKITSQPNIPMHSIISLTKDEGINVNLLKKSKYVSRTHRGVDLITFLKKHNINGTLEVGGDISGPRRYSLPHSPTRTGILSRIKAVPMATISIDIQKRQSRVKNDITSVLEEAKREPLHPASKSKQLRKRNSVGFLPLRDLQFQK